MRWAPPRPDKPSPSPARPGMRLSECLQPVTFGFAARSVRPQRRRARAAPRVRTDAPFLAGTALDFARGRHGPARRARASAERGVPIRRQINTNFQDVGRMAVGMRFDPLPRIPTSQEAKRLLSTGGSTARPALKPWSPLCGGDELVDPRQLLRVGQLRGYSARFRRIHGQSPGGPDRPYGRSVLGVLSL